MYNLNRNDLEDILKLVNFCMTHIKKGTLDSKHLLSEMLEVFRSYDAEFFPPNQSLNGVDMSNSFCIKEEKTDLLKYVNYYWRYDPLYSAQFSLKPVNRVFKTDDVIPYPQLKKLDYYQDYLKHINWFGELVIRLCTDDGFWGTMSLTRSPKQPYFNRSDVQKAELLLPYLINTYEATVFFSKINEERKVFEQWLESRPEGVILLDAEMRPICYNKKAKQMCGPLSNEKPKSLQKNPDDEIKLPKMIVEDCKSLVGSHNTKQYFSHSRIINTKSRDRFYIKYTLVNQPGKDIILPYCIVHINGLSKRDDETGVVLPKDYGLSKREEAIAQYTSSGLTNKEIGEKLGISTFTVQTHLRNIFEKTGINTRSQLANLVK
ncbi:MAG: helix-turn-helix transcriptional regulator [Dehalococcoidales bacterium]|jgi:DNA-binding CsgD family transcriptional regulator